MRKLVMQWVVVSFLVAGCGSADVAWDAPLDQSEGDIMGGTVDTQDSFAVGIFDAARGGTCSGALIGPNLVLTARHCVARIPSGPATCSVTFGANLDPTKLHVTTDPVMRNGARFHRGTRIFVPSGSSLCDSDLALIELEDLVPAADAKLVTPAVEYPLTDGSRYGRTITAIGYGVTGQPAIHDSGTRRIRRDMTVRCIPGDSAIPCPATVPTASFLSSAGACSGDSGSSAYDQAALDTGKLVSLGVVSRGPRGCAGSLYTRTDQFKDVIVQAATQAAHDGHYPLPAWAAPAAPEPEPARAPAPTTTGNP